MSEWTQRRRRVWTSVALGMALGMALGATTNGCVSQGRFDAQVATAASEKGRADGCRRDLVDAKERIAREQLAYDDEASALAKVHVEDENHRTDLQSAEDLAGEHRKELDRLRDDLIRLAKQKSVTEGALADGRTQIDALVWARTRVDLADAILKSLLAQFAATPALAGIGGESARGAVHLHLTGAPLFEPGRRTIKPSAKALFADLSAAIAALRDVHVTVVAFADEGETGGHSAEVAWDLALARSNDVVRRLFAAGAASASLSSTGVVDPRSPSARDDLEIVIEPLAIRPSAFAPPKPPA